MLSVVWCIVAGTVALGACSDDEGAGIGPGATSTTTAAPQAQPDDGVVYVVHAVTTEIRRDGDVVRVVLGGVERRTAWLAGDTSGVLPTAAFVEQWPDLGLGAEPPQAAFVPAAYDQDGAILELSDPVWDEESRVLTYTALAPDEPDESLLGLIADEDGDPPAELPIGQIGATTVMIHQLGDDRPVAPGPTTTTTTSTTTTAPGPTSTSTTSTTVASTPTTPASTTTVFVAAPPPPTAPQPPPQGDPRIITNLTELRLPSAGGSTTFTLRNIGTGVGSWSINTSQGVGISVAPSAGVLFPGSTTTVRVTYDGTYVVDDFKAEVVVVTARGVITIEVTVGGD
jgi:hypothetical protein